MTGQHRPPPPPPRLTIARVAIADGGLLALSLTVATAVAFAPHAHAPVTVAAPTAVDLREPTGHGGPITYPTFADPHVWTEDKGPVIADGQALPQPVISETPVVTDTPPDVNSAPENSRAAEEPAPVAAAQPAPEPAPATDLLALVNADRAANGCGPVTIADDLTSQAQTHSNGQAAADSMFHSASIQGYDTAAENVALGPETETEAELHTRWMASPKHRDNILGCQYAVIGYAFADGESGRYWTEMFAA